MMATALNVITLSRENAVYVLQNSSKYITGADLYADSSFSP